MQHWFLAASTALVRLPSDTGTRGIHITFPAGAGGQSIGAALGLSQKQTRKFHPATWLPGKRVCVWCFGRHDTTPIWGRSRQ